MTVQANRRATGATAKRFKKMVEMYIGILKADNTAVDMVFLQFFADKMLLIGAYLTIRDPKYQLEFTKLLDSMRVAYAKIKKVL
jgi:hypothetical protein